MDETGFAHPSTADRAAAWLVYERGTFPDQERAEMLESTAWKRAPLPACLYYNETPLTDRAAIEDARKRELPHSVFFPDQMRRRMTDAEARAHFEAAHDAHYHGVACRYRERLAALKQWKRDLAKAMRDTGATKARKEADAIYKAHQAELSEILASPCVTPADYMAKMELVAEFAEINLKAPGPYLRDRSIAALYRDLARFSGTVIRKEACHASA